jgi:catechol 2,3-dioxygenase
MIQTKVFLMCMLVYIHLNTPNLGAMAMFYREQLGLHAASKLTSDGSQAALLSEVIEVTSSESVLLRGPGRQIVLSHAHQAGLKEIGLEVFASRWREACLILRKFNAVTVEQHPIFKKAMAINDPEGNRIVFGVGSRLGKRVITGIRKDFGAGANLAARLQHFGLGSARISELAAFYQNKIGFALSDYVTGEDRKLRSTFMRGTEEHHVLALFGNGKPGLDHFSFEAPDWNGIRDWADHFAQFGTKIFWGAGRHGVGNNLFIFVHDPDGNMVEISAELDQVPFGQAAGHWSFDYKAFNLWGPAAIRV